MMRMRSTSDTPLSRQLSSPASLERHSMMEFSGQGRPGRQARGPPMTPEERQGQRERKVAMRKALRELLSEAQAQLRVQSDALVAMQVRASHAAAAQRGKQLAVPPHALDSSETARRSSCDPPTR